MVMFWSLFVCSVALSAGGYPLPGLAYGKTTIPLTHRIYSKFELLGRTMATVAVDNTHLQNELSLSLPEVDFIDPLTPEPIDKEQPLIVAEQEDPSTTVPHLPATTGENIAKILREIPDDVVVDDRATFQDEPFDLEYLAILHELDRRHSLYKITHRDLQWKICAELLKTLPDNEDRVELVTVIRKYPLHRRLPATVAISPKIHDKWTEARDLFYERIQVIN